MSITVLQKLIQNFIPTTANSRRCKKKPVSRTTEVKAPTSEQVVTCFEPVE